MEMNNNNKHLILINNYNKINNKNNKDNNNNAFSSFLYWFHNFLLFARSFFTHHLLDVVCQRGVESPQHIFIFYIIFLIEI